MAPTWLEGRKRPWAPSRRRSSGVGEHSVSGGAASVIVGKPPPSIHPAGRWMVGGEGGDVLGCETATTHHCMRLWLVRHGLDQFGG